jgi:hypothetical protein
MLWETLYFFINLGEVVVSVSLILIAALIIAKVAFWAVSRTLGIFSASPVYEDETDDRLATPTPPNDTSIADDEH